MRIYLVVDDSDYYTSVLHRMFSSLEKAQEYRETLWVGDDLRNQSRREINIEYWTVDKESLGCDSVMLQDGTVRGEDE